jgi:hypothetical protein
MAMFIKSMNNDPTMGTTKKAVLEYTYFSVIEFIFAMAFDVEPMANPVKPATRPKVAAVKATVRASGYPRASRLGATAAAVPCPPVNAEEGLIIDLV